MTSGCLQSKLQINEACMQASLRSAWCCCAPSGSAPAALSCCSLASLRSSFVSWMTCRASCQQSGNGTCTEHQQLLLLHNQVQTVGRTAVLLTRSDGALRWKSSPLQSRCTFPASLGSQDPSGAAAPPGVPQPSTPWVSAVRTTAGATGNKGHEAASFEVVANVMG